MGYSSELFSKSVPNRMDNEISKNHEYWMNEALVFAEYAESIGEIPIGAVIVKDNKIIGHGWNNPIQSCDPTSHAEINAIRDAARNVNNYRILNSTIYVTFEPCIMCLGAIQQARLSEIIFGAEDHSRMERLNGLDRIKYDTAQSLLYQGGVLSRSCARILSDFFKDKR